MTTSNEHNNAPAVPQTVYLVENRTCLLAYASREDADKAVASMPASVGGGFLVSPVQVFGAPAPAPAQAEGRDMFKGMLERSLNDQFLPAIDAIMWAFDAWSESADLRTAVTAPAQEVTPPYHRDIWGISHAIARINEAEYIAAFMLDQEPVGLTDEHPMQPIIFAGDGVIRFKKNQIVSDLYDLAAKHGLDMNGLACRKYPREDRNQFAQLIGYSVSGWGDLSYAMGVEEADAIAALRAKGGKHA